MSELDKLAAGEWYQFKDAEVAAQKARAAKLCQEFNQIDATNPDAQTARFKRFLVVTVAIFPFKQTLIVIMVVIFMLVIIFLVIIT